MVPLLMGLCCRLDLFGIPPLPASVSQQGPGSGKAHRLVGELCLTLFKPVCVGSRTVCLVDGIKVPQEGKMPAVKKPHQQPASNSKPEYI
jgi:hypothetical protein